MTEDHPSNTIEVLIRVLSTRSEVKKGQYTRKRLGSGVPFNEGASVQSSAIGGESGGSASLLGRTPKARASRQVWERSALNPFRTPLADDLFFCSYFKSHPPPGVRHFHR
jgi:hypothetical protein